MSAGRAYSRQIIELTEDRVFEKIFVSCELPASYLLTPEYPQTKVGEQNTLMERNSPCRHFS